MTKPIAVKCSFLASILILAGCDQTDSQSIPTSEIAPDIKVIAQNSDTSTEAQVEVILRRGTQFNAPHIELSSGDQLSVTAEAQTYLLERSILIFVTQYVATVPDAGLSTEFIVGFDRASETSAPTSTVMLPQSFDIAALPKETFDLSETVTLEWDNNSVTDRAITFKFNAGCTLSDSSFEGNSGSSEIPDNGEATLVLADVFDTIDTAEAVSCSASITLERSVEGDLDPNFGSGGDILGIQRRVVEFDVSGE